jgi:hypothetical protein
MAVGDRIPTVAGAAGGDQRDPCLEQRVVRRYVNLRNAADASADLRRNQR